MDRRDFLFCSGTAAFCAMLSTPALALSPNAGFKLGYQLYSVRDDMNNDPEGTLLALKKMGYQHFELYGFDPTAGTFYNMPAPAFKSLLDDLELSVTSGHYGFAPYLEKSDKQLTEFVDRCIEGAKTIGSDYITWPWTDPAQRNIATFKRLPQLLNKIGKQVSDAGLGFAYHNHGFEFEIKDDSGNGENAYNIIVNQTDPDLVKLQLDMYWVSRSSSTTPQALVRQHPGRYVMWHVKDMDKQTQDYTELGNGSIDYTAILPDTSTSGLRYFYIEQGGNFSQSPMKSAATSAAYFKAHLAKYFV
ncbi:sugar phosphate isomerase/epimerase family protein [Alteromonas gilva]|uniref:Sugar phosphate isomerase/epimerase n=1 Tax=Alteromonas gilva TaxID=2987522 RepID=A0ABT5L0G6_9ALTE|nr:sugar phosphate isomerase/epimerase [Alteromonas gilva]MDC8830521.1 sugar phosphate isomerase/epimerase [Alteromonas gilva]